MEDKTLGSLVSAVSGATTMEKYPAGPAGRCALCVSQCLCCVLVSRVPLSVLSCSPRHAATRAAQLPAGCGTREPGSLRALPSGQSRHPTLAWCCIPCLCCPPATILSSLSCLCPPIPVLVPPCVSEPAGRLCPGDFSMQPIASMLGWAGHSVWWRVLTASPSVRRDEWSSRGGLSSRSPVVSVCSPGVWQMRLGSPSSLASSQMISCRLLLRFLLPLFLPDGWR